MTPQQKLREDYHWNRPHKTYPRTVGRGNRGISKIIGELNMNTIICSIFGHKLTNLNTRRHFAWCDRCAKGLEVTYDMMFGETVVVRDYGNQKTFCWCSDCGNELISSGSYQDLQNDINRYEYFRCSICGRDSKWDFDAPVPLELPLL